MSEPLNPHLELTRDEMRQLGYRVIDILVDHYASLADQPVGRTASRQELERLLREPLPQQGAPFEQVLRLFEQIAQNTTLHVNHPRFFAFIPSPSNFVSVMADTLAGGFNVFAGTWLAGSGLAEIELVTIDWLRQACGMPESAGGLFVSGGSVANLTGLAIARHLKLAVAPHSTPVVYYSDQTHSSVDRALAVLGFVPAQIRKIPSDENFRISLSDLRREIVRDRAEGRVPFCVVANVGTTNTGAVDPLGELSAICREFGLWLHADGAYGAAAAFCPQLREQLQGMSEVDSLSLDPHKWLFQPFELGALLVRDHRWLKQTFAIHPDYMKDTNRADEEVNFCECGIQLTRSTRALKLWASLKVFGAESFRAAIARGLELAEFAEKELRAQGCWEIITKAQMAIVSFRYSAPRHRPDELERINQGLVAKMMADGFALLTSTVLRGQTALRFCTINPRTTEADIRETVRRLTAFAQA